MDTGPNQPQRPAPPTDGGKPNPWRRVWKLFRPRRDVALITSHRYTPAESLRRKERRYAWLQGARIPLLLMSAFTYLHMHNVWLSSILFFISVPLPWIAVVVGNGQGEPRDKRMASVYKPQVLREAQQAHDRLLESSIETIALPAAAQPDRTGDSAAAPGHTAAGGWVWDPATGTFVAAPANPDDDGGSSGLFSHTGRFS